MVQGPYRHSVTFFVPRSLCNRPTLNETGFVTVTLTKAPGVFSWFEVALRACGIMNKIRFAIGIQNFSREKGGAERYLIDLCRRMAAEGYEVHVFAEGWQEEDPRLHFHRIRTIPFPKSLRLLSFAVRATGAIREGDFDITFGVGNTLEADVLQPHGGVHWAWFWRSLGAYDDPVLRMMKFLGRVFSPKQWVNGWIEDAPYKRAGFQKIVAILLICLGLGLLVI